jgi:hypothetical protein
VQELFHIHADCHVWLYDLPEGLKDCTIEAAGGSVGTVCTHRPTTGWEA